ncbi:MAG: phosphate propanoyltransferase [Firmicutes bacterium]|nr:phosphate propanoyltransferase [Bacillota bacterium]
MSNQAPPQGIPVGVSNRHIHLSQHDLCTLFGEGHELTKFRDLGQPGQYACAETVTIAGPKGSFEGVRVMGPVRDKTQIEVSRSDAFKLGVEAPLRESGSIHGSAGLVVKGPKGEIRLKEGCILAMRHIHMSPAEAARFGCKDGDVVSIRVDKGDRKTTFDDVLVRVSPKYALECHIDTDEANAALLSTGDTVVLVMGCK